MSHFNLSWKFGSTCCYAQGKRSKYSVDDIKVDGTTRFAAFVKGKYKATYLTRGDAMRRCEAYDALPWWNLSNPFR